MVEKQGVQRTCPACHAILFKDSDLEIKDGRDRISFKMRCPKCGKQLKVSVGSDITIYQYEG